MSTTILIYISKTNFLQENKEAITSYGLRVAGLSIADLGSGIWDLKDGVSDLRGAGCELRVPSCALGKMQR